MAIDIYEGAPRPVVEDHAPERLAIPSASEERTIGSVAFRYRNDLPNLTNWKDGRGDPRFAGWPSAEAATTHAYEERSRQQATEAWLRGDLSA